MSLINVIVYRGGAIGATQIYRNGVVAQAPQMASFTLQIGAVHYNDWIEVQSSSDSWGTGDYVAFFMRGFVKVGIIVDTQFINNNSMRIFVTESAWDTACANGTVDVQGVISRTHLTGGVGTFGTRSLLPEPFPTYSQNVQTGDAATNRATLIRELNNFARNTNMHFILLVSERIRDRLGVSAWTLNPTINTNLRVTNYEDIPTSVFASYSWGLGNVAGFPIVFSSQNNLSNFLTNMMQSGLVSNPNMTQGQSQILLNNMAGAVIFDGGTDGAEKAQLTILYNADDILGVMRVPADLAVASPPLQHQFNLTFDNSATHAKLNTYPYTHQTIITPAGDELHIIPHNEASGTSNTYTCIYRFEPSMNPRIVLTTSQSGEHALVEAYDCLSYSIDGYTSSLTNFNAQTAKKFANVRASIDANSGTRMGMGAIGGAVAGAKLGSIVPGVGNVIGAGLGALGGLGASAFRDSQSQNQAETDTLLNASANSINALSANPSVTSGSGAVSLRSDFNCSENGVTIPDKRMMDSALTVFGESCSGNGSLRGGGTWGSISVRIFSGQYLQFSSIRNITNAPSRTHAEIASIFLNGVFII